MWYRSTRIKVKAARRINFPIKKQAPRREARSCSNTLVRYPAGQTRRDSQAVTCAGALDGKEGDVK